MDFETRRILKPPGLSTNEGRPYLQLNNGMAKAGTNSVYAVLCFSCQHTRGNLAYEANYCAGLRILDVAAIEGGAEQVQEVAYFDVAPDWNTVSDCVCFIPFTQLARLHNEQS